jgi:hypothetical protein
MDLEQVRRRCTALVDELDIPLPFDAHELCARLAARRGRPIRLLPLSLPTDSPCGLWVSANETDYIIYEQATSRLHQEHIILHEVGHLISDHRSAPLLDDETSRLLFPNLDPSTIQRILGRTHYSALEEQQAEMIASLILQQASRWSPEPRRTVPPDAAGIVDRLEHSLEHPPDGRGGRRGSDPEPDLRGRGVGGDALPAP